MIKKISIFLTCLLFNFHAVASDVTLKNVTLSGTYLGGFNSIHQQNATHSPRRTQFDYAANIDISADISDSFSLLVQFQASPGDGSMGFVNGIEVTDMVLIANLQRLFGTGNDSEHTLTFGSFDTPFGRETDRLSNNGDTFSNPTLLNPLMYSAFAGAFGTLNTLGAYYQGSGGAHSYGLAFSNGTSEGAANTDGGISVMANYSHRFHPVEIGVSYMQSNDFNSDEIVGFGADFQGILADITYTYNEHWQLSMGAASLTYGDSLSETDDQVFAWMTDLVFNSDRWIAALAVSGWIPEDNNGDGKGISSAIPNPGFGTLASTSESIVTDQNSRRYELSLTYKWMPKLWVRSSVFYDDYDKTSFSKHTDVAGILAFINAGF